MERLVWDLIYKFSIYYLIINPVFRLIFLSYWQLTFSIHLPFHHFLNQPVPNHFNLS